MSIQILRSQDYKRVPWKNGRGFTSEILISPAGSDFAKDPFDWRLSTATLTEPGEFSLFPGYDRVLTVVSEGEVVINDLDTSVEKTLRRGNLFRFPGEARLASRLPVGPVVDLNWIVKRGHFSRIELFEIGRVPRVVVGPSLIFAVSGAITLSGGTEVVRAGDTVLAPQKSSAEVSAYGARAFVALIQTDLAVSTI